MTQTDVTVRPRRRPPPSLPRSNDTWPGLPPGKLPKVALLFLTRGDLPHEPIWRSFLLGLPNIAGGAKSTVAPSFAGFQSRRDTLEGDGRAIDPDREEGPTQGEGKE